MSLKHFAFDVLFIGHSLVGPDMPDMLERAVTSMGGTAQVEAQIINGAPVGYNWENGAQAQGVNAREVLPGGEFEIVVITEAVPLLNHLNWSGTVENVQRYYDLAVESQPDAQVYFYETWHSLNSGTAIEVEWDDEGHIPWRQRLDTDLPRWTGVIDDINASLRPDQTPIKLVPAGQAMGLLYDQIEAGQVPGLTDISDVFHDDIHPNAIGLYFVTLVQFATLYGTDPDDLPIMLGVEPAPTVELAEALQTIAWQAVQEAGR